MADNVERMKQIEAKESELQDLYDRMDTDASLVKQEEFYLVDKNNNVIEGVVNVTSNEPPVFANAMATILNESHMQTYITGDNLPDKQASKIEKFIDCAKAQADLGRIMRR